MLLKLALRNIFRHKRRTLLTVFMMVGGYIILSFSIALVDGSYGDAIKLFTSQFTGHAQVHHKDYVKKPSLYKTINKPKILEKKLNTYKEIRAYSPRVLSGALTFANKKTSGVEVVGVDWKKEDNTTSLSLRVHQGQIPTSQDNNDVLIGGVLAKSLKIKLNDEIILISQGADGSIANDIFKVRGLLKTGGRDDRMVYMSAQSAQNFYSLYGQFHEFAISFNKIRIARKFTKNFKAPENLMMRPWQKVEVDFFRAMEVDKKANRISYFIITLVVALGVLNTVLMSILERTREFGVLKALGTSKYFMTSLIILEAQLISLISLVIGALIALFLNGYFAKYGLSLSESFSYGGVSFDKMYTYLSLNSFLYPALIVSGSTFLVSLYPCWKASTISPVEAMRNI